MSSGVREAVVRVLGTTILGAMGIGLLASCSATTSSPPVVRVSSVQAQSYIVEARSSELAAEAVLAAGGKVDSRLNIIDAVEAKLTDAQHAQVLAAPGIRQICVKTLVTTHAGAYVDG